jgi:hypothetical protein
LPENVLTAFSFVNAVQSPAGLTPALVEFGMLHPPLTMTKNLWNKGMTGAGTRESASGVANEALRVAAMAGVTLGEGKRTTQLAVAGVTNAIVLYPTKTESEVGIMGADNCACVEQISERARE